MYILFIIAIVMLILYCTIIIVMCGVLAIITIQTNANGSSVCTGKQVMFTCAVDRNGTNITCDNVKWRWLRSGRSRFQPTNISRFKTFFNHTRNISKDILTNTLAISDVKRKHKGLYRCVVPVSHVVSRNASLIVKTGKLCGMHNTVEPQLSGPILSRF